MDDIRHGVRRLLARPAYALLAVLTLALGVGGTAATFGIARGCCSIRCPTPTRDEVGVFWKKSDWTEEEFLLPPRTRPRLPAGGAATGSAT